MKRGSFPRFAVRMNQDRRGARPRPVSGAARLPDRWQEYSAVGQRLSGTRFIAFKVPLKKMFANSLLSNEVFTPTDLLRKIGEQNEELGKIIDLTFTKRYYDSEELPKGLYYEKIFTAGHEVPSEENISKFKRAVKTFLLENVDNDKLIGVHCTHGVNRTGYLICRYLIDVDGMDPREAIDLFNRSRGYSIERQNYIQDLLQGPHRSNKGLDVLVPWLVTKQEGHFRQQPMFTPRDSTNQRKYRGRSDCRNFSRPACPAGQYADSFSPMHLSRGQWFRNGALYQPVVHHGQSGGYSGYTDEWKELSWRSCQPTSRWQVDSVWGNSQAVCPRADYPLQQSSRGKKQIWRGQIGLNTHLRWNN
ncbi:RNA/RNP complex-1-interacting phosphatase-like [Narcine bancroftii]|uniref:RNA/RNP complex-1-interacting phosphatase-like n=1 Tax=Narcine bancroftii TaxID=1343680 RepID=UPI003830FE8F